MAFFHIVSYSFFINKVSFDYLTTPITLKPQLLIENSNYIILLSLLIISFFLFIYSFFKIKKTLKNNFAGKNNEGFIKNKEYQTYLLFLGIISPITEINLVLFQVRPASLLQVHLIIGALLLILYLISTKSHFVFQNIKNIFIATYLLYFGLICRNLIFLPTDVIPMIAFVVSFFFCYTILKPIKLYWYLCAILAVFICSVYLFKLIPEKTIIILFNYYLIVFIITIFVISPH